MKRTGSIEGIVRNSNEVPLEDVNIIIVSGATQQDIAAITGADGTFGFSNLLPGNYLLKAFSSRVESDRIPVRVVAGKIAFVEIYLEAATPNTTTKGEDEVVEDEVVDEITTDSFMDSNRRCGK